MRADMNNREYHEVWVFDGKNTVFFADTQEKALKQAEDTGYKFDIRFHRENWNGASLLPSDVEV